MRPISWDELVAEMDEALTIPGQVNAWTMPIKARIDMLSTGIRTPVGIKILGADLEEISRIGEHLEAVLRDVPGTRSAYAERTVGGYYLDIIPNRREIARYGLNVEDVLMVGGDGHRRHGGGPHHRRPRTLHASTSATAANCATIRRSSSRCSCRSVAWSSANRRRRRRGDGTTPRLATRRLSDSAVAQIPLGQLADIQITTGPPLIKNEDGALTGWVYVDVAGRDIGGYVAEAKRAVRGEDRAGRPAARRLPARMDRPVRIHAARAGTAEGRRAADAASSSSCCST